MTIRKTQLADLEALRLLYAHAREQMKKNGNPSQWGDSRPSEDTILADIRNSQSYIITEELSSTEKYPMADRLPRTETYPTGKQLSSMEIYPAADRFSRKVKYPTEERLSRMEKYPAAEQLSRAEKYPTEEQLSSMEKYPAAEQLSRKETYPAEIQLSRIQKYPAADRLPRAETYPTEKQLSSMEIYPAADRFSRKETYPAEKQLSAIKNAGICGTFAFIIGDDPTYRILEHGHWLNQAPYGTIHRLASSGSVKGIFSTCLAWCLAQIPNIRIDTHQDNLVMQHLLEKNGFHKCGIIYVEDNSPRLAYQKSLDA